MEKQRGWELEFFFYFFNIKNILTSLIGEVSIKFSFVKLLYCSLFFCMIEN